MQSIDFWQFREDLDNDAHRANELWAASPNVGGPDDAGGPRASGEPAAAAGSSGYLEEVCDTVAGGDGQGAAGTPARFKPLVNNVTSGRPLNRPYLRSERCRSRVCPDCGPLLGFKVRRNLAAKCLPWVQPRVLTLTVDRSKFLGPEAAHRFVTSDRLIPRLLRLLGFRTWFWVLEFQDDSGDGWPHWHILVDLSECGGFVKLRRAWRLWRDKWGVGGVDLGRKKKRFESPEHAVNYITKYLVKYPDSGYPAWVLEARYRIRFCAASKAVGAIVTPPAAEFGVVYGCMTLAEAEAAEAACESDPAERAPSGRLLDRVGRCGAACSVFEDREVVDEASGEITVKPQYVARIKGDLGAVLAHAPHLVEKLSTEVGERVYLVGAVWSCIQAVESISDVWADGVKRFQQRCERVADTVFSRRAVAAGGIWYAPWATDQDRELADLIAFSAPSAQALKSEARAAEPLLSRPA